ncbi:MAG: SDR family NAD(P)-dependent oxidoreductase [Lentilitoribacter sp.]
MSGLYVITGSSRGLGLALAKLLAERGDQVIGLSRSEGEFSHQNYTHEICDITNEEEVKTFFNELRQKGLLFCLINNAGIATSIPALMMKSNTFEETLRVNLLGAFTVTREALKLMKRQRFGRIVNMSSINVKLSSAGGIAYNASKAGLESISHTISSEISSSEDITTNNIGVSLMDGSGMVEGLSEKALNDKITFLKRTALLEPEEILHAVDFFASEKATNITGQTVYFGGL